MNFTFFRGRTFRVLVVLVVFLVLLPELVRFALIKTIPSLGLGDASIEDVDLNLFNGKAAVTGFTLTRDHNRKLSIADLEADFSWVQLLRGNFHAESILLRGSRLSAIQSDEGEWELVLPVTTTSDDSNTRPAIVLPRVAAEQITLSDIELTVIGLVTKGSLIVDSLHLTQLSSWQNQPMTVALQARWNDAPIEFTATVTPWDLQPHLKAELTLDGLPLDDIAQLVGQPLSGFIDINLDIDGERDEQGHMSADTHIVFSMQQFSADYKNLGLRSHALSGQGSITAGLSAGNFLEYALQGTMESADFRLIDIEQALTLASWERLKLEGLSLDEQLNAIIENLYINQLEVIKTAELKPATVFVGALELAGLSLREGTELTIDRLALIDSQHQLKITSEGQLPIQTILASTRSGLQSADDVSVNAADVQSTAALTLALNNFEVSGDSYIAFLDERYDGAVEQKLAIETLTVTDLDQKQLDLPAQVKLVGKLGEFSMVAVQGELKLFAEKPGLKLKGELDAIPLPGLSPYSEAHLGYHLSRGQYDHQFELIIENDEITLNNQLFLRRLSLEAVDPDKPQAMERVMDVPLEFALDMLSDGDDNIELDVPIKGRMNDPDVNINNVINNALGNALKKGATSFLTLALQPYGAVLLAADFINDKMSAIQLDPIEYPAGTAELSPTQREYLAKISSLLGQRPKLELTICAKSNEADKLVLQAGAPDQPVAAALLVALADQRANAIKRQLVDGGVEGRRLFLCQPGYKVDAGNAVSLTL